jgi:hypothetical protein
MGDYDITEEQIESAMKHIRLSDLLSLNDAVEEQDMGTIIDILEPFIPGILPQTNERLSPTHATGRNVGNKDKKSRDTVITAVGSNKTGFNPMVKPFGTKGAIATNRKIDRQVAGGAKIASGAPERSGEFNAITVTDPTGAPTQVDDTASKEIASVMARMARRLPTA